MFMLYRFKCLNIHISKHIFMAKLLLFTMQKEKQTIHIKMPENNHRKFNLLTSLFHRHEMITKHFLNSQVSAHTQNIPLHELCTNK